MKADDLKHILEFLTPATLAGILNDLADCDELLGQRRQIAALVREVLVANVGEQDADAMIEAVVRMM